MSKPLFGRVLDQDFTYTRDAVHIPIVPVIAGGFIKPRSLLTLSKKSSGDIFAKVSEMPTSIAVVDPFISETINPGEIFYAWLRPESAQKLWHEWTHRQLD